MIALFAAGCSSAGGGSSVTGSGGGWGGGGGSAATSGSAATGGSGGFIGGGGSGGFTIDGGGGSANLTTPVDVIITADNAYGFGYGTSTTLGSYFGGVENASAGQIFNCPVGNGPEAYTVPAASANAGDYLYIIGYADKSTTQGVIAEFSRAGAAPVFTGDGAWEVCATGQDFNVGSGGPTQAQIEAQLVACNAGSGDPATTSAGWVGTAGGARGSVAFGEDNTTDRTVITPGNEFPIVCDIDGQARWMWYQWDANSNPFIWPGGSGNPAKEFLIFRLGAERVPEPPR